MADPLDDPDYFWRQQRSPEQEAAHRRERVEQIKRARGFTTSPQVAPPERVRHPKFQAISDRVRAEIEAANYVKLPGSWPISKTLAAQRGIDLSKPAAPPEQADQDGPRN